MDKVGLIVGCGSIGLRHLENLLASDVSSVAVVDTDTDRLHDATDLGATNGYTRVSEAISRENPHFGLVCVPNHVHVPIAEEMVRADLDVFVEKPLSHTLDGTLELARIADDRDLISMVGCNLRFHPGIRKLRELVVGGSVGLPTSIRIEAGSYLPDWHPDEDHTEMYSANESMGGGAVLDFIHEINYARWLCGEVESVSAMLGRESDLGIETEDTAGMLVRFDSGVIGEIHVDYVQRAYSRSCKVVGTEGILRWHWQDDYVEEYDTESESWIRHQLPEWEMNRMYIDELDHFLHCIDTRQETLCDFAEGRSDLRVALAAKQAARANEQVSPNQLE